MKFYTSDLHLGHEQIIYFDDRPFTNVEVMNKVIIDNWNSVVNNNDDVYILGDFAWRNDIGYAALKQLKGNKYFVRGESNQSKSNTVY